MKEDYQKALKKLSLFFLPNPVPFNVQRYQKQKGSGISHHSLFRPQNTSICSFQSGKCGKEGKKSQEFEYLENEKIFLDEIKSIFQFLKGYHLVKQ